MKYFGGIFFANMGGGGWSELFSKNPGNCSAFSGSEKGVFWKRGLFRKVHFLEILEILENRQTGNQRRISPFSRDSREFRDFRDSRDSSGEKTPFVMTPFSGPDFWS